MINGEFLTFLDIYLSTNVNNHDIYVFIVL